MPPRAQNNSSAGERFLGWVHLVRQITGGRKRRAYSTISHTSENSFAAYKRRTTVTFSAARKLVASPTKRLHILLSHCQRSLAATVAKGAVGTASTHRSANIRPAAGKERPAFPLRDAARTRLL